MIDLGLYQGLPDILYTEGLLPVVDVVWDVGWSQPTVESLRSAEGAAGQSRRTALPRRGVIAVFLRELPDMLRVLERDGGGGRYIVVARDGDSLLSRVLTQGLPSCVQHLFAVYTQTSARTTPMPFALRWRTHVESLVPYLAVPRTKERSVLVAHQNLHWFRPGHERRVANAYFRDKPWATVREAPDNQYPMTNDEYLRALRSHDYFVAASGDGNQDGGVERVAMWEGLALGCVPLCTRRQVQWNDLPVAVVDCWEQVTEGLCDASIDALHNQSLDRVRLTYWLKKIYDKTREL